MPRQEIINNLRTRIKDIESRPASRSMLAGLFKANSSAEPSTEPVYIPASTANTKMLWKNLEKALCPKCSQLLIDHPDKKYLVKCTVCDFLISNQKLKQILKKSNN